MISTIQPFERINRIKRTDTTRQPVIKRQKILVHKYMHTSIQWTID
nr:MAG TPA: hypothetical protein [Bacteriophage sp.]